MIRMFTDGASKGNPGPGGWGAIISLKSEEGEHVVELGGREESTTNNRMELKAVIEGLFYISEISHHPIHVRIFTDSRYVVMGASRWIHGWKKNGWKTATKSDVLNKDLWERYSEIASGIEIEWKLLPGHRGIPGNERADVIASALASGDHVELFKGSIASYGVDLNVTEAASTKNKSGKAYSYLSMVDDVVVRHKTWDACKARVTGKKAKYKKALSPEAEVDILKEWGREGASIQDED